jgi:hypothetical protein
MPAIPQEEHCPVPDSLLGDLYRASPEGLHALVESIAPQVRAMLAIYCARRSHMTSLALAIASTCERSELVVAGHEFGAALFAQSRQAPTVVPGKRRKVTLATASAMQLIVAQDLI